MSEKVRYKRLYSSERKEFLKTMEKEEKKACQNHLEPAKAISEYDSCIRIGRQNYSTSLDDIASHSDVENILPKPIIIDGVNILYVGSRFEDSRIAKPFPDVLALLSVIRFFVSQGIEVIVITTSKFHEKTRKGVHAGYSNFAAGLDKLYDYGIALLTPRGTEYRKLVIRMAHTVHGLVVSNDKYRNYGDFVMANRVGIRFEEIPKNDRYTRTRNGNHFIAGKIFHFGDRMHMTNEDVKNKFFVRDKELQYIFVEDRRKTVFTKKQKDDILALLDELILEGLKVHQANTERIMKIPIELLEVDDGTGSKKKF